MVESDWGAWLPREIADAEPTGLDLWYLGCNGVVLKAADGTTVFIDPYLGTGDPPRTVRMIPIPFDPIDVRACDAILATHEHTDHVHGPSQAPILSGTSSDFYGPADSLSVTQEEAWTERWDVDPDQLHAIDEGEALEIGSLTVHVEPANDPDATHPVSYVVEHPTGTFFHGGDARPGQPFVDIGARYDLDLGVLAFGAAGMIIDRETGDPTYTRWYSDQNMIVEAASQLRLDRLLPSHWDMWRGMTTDPASVVDHARSFEHPRNVEVVRIGDRVSV